MIRVASVNTTTFNGSPASVDAAAPSGLAIGDYLIAHITPSNNNSFTTPSGFELLGSKVGAANDATYIFGAKVVATPVLTGEISLLAAYHFAWTSGQGGVATLVRVVDYDPADPIGAVINAEGSGATVTLPAIASGIVSGARLLMFGAADRTDGSTVATWTAQQASAPKSTEIYDVSEAGSSVSHSAYITGDITGGSTPTRDLFASLSPPNAPIGVGVVINPDPGKLGTFEDTFTDSSGTLLTAHTADTGQAYSNNTSEPGASVITAEGRLRPNAANTVTSPRVTTALSGPNQFLEADIWRIGVPGGVSEAGVWLRVGSGAAQTGYLFRWNYSADCWEIWSAVAGTFTLLRAWYDPFPMATGAKKRIRAEVFGNRLRLYVDGVLRISLVDRQVTATGFLGLRMHGSTTSDANGIHMDNVSGGVLSVEASTDKLVVENLGLRAPNGTWVTNDSMTLTAPDGQPIADVGDRIALLVYTYHQSLTSVTDSKGNSYAITARRVSTGDEKWTLVEATVLSPLVDGDTISVNMSSATAVKYVAWRLKNAGPASNYATFFDFAPATTYDLSTATPASNRGVVLGAAAKDETGSTHSVDNATRPALLESNENAAYAADNAWVIEERSDAASSVPPRIKGVFTVAGRRDAMVVFIPEKVSRYDFVGPVAIPDNALQTGAIATFNITGDVIAVNELSLYLTHSWDSDIWLYLEGPDGRSITLVGNRGASADNFGSGSADASRTRFRDDAATQIGAGAAPFVGTFKPEVPLSRLVGPLAEPITVKPGIWKLYAYDLGNGDTGSIQAASLIVTEAASNDVWAGPSVRSADEWSSGGSPGTTSIVARAPENVAVGDLLVIGFEIYNGSGNPIPSGIPSGFVFRKKQIATTQNNLYVYSKIADAADVAISAAGGTYTFTFPSGTQGQTSTFAIKDADPDSIAFAGATSTSGGSVVAPAVAVEENSILLTFVGWEGQSPDRYAKPPNTVRPLTGRVSPGGLSHLHTFDERFTADGSSGTRTFSQENSGTSTMAVIVMSIGGIETNLGTTKVKAGGAFAIQTSKIKVGGVFVTHGKIKLPPIVATAVQDFAWTAEAVDGGPNHSVNVPVSNPGDKLLMIAQIPAGSTPTLSGWTSLGSIEASPIHLHAWEKVAGSSEATVQTLAEPTYNMSVAAACFRFNPDVDRDSISFSNDYNNGGPGGRSRLNMPSVPVNADDLILDFVAMRNDNKAWGVDPGPMVLLESQTKKSQRVTESLVTVSGVTGAQIYNVSPDEGYIDQLAGVRVVMRQ